MILRRILLSMSAVAFISHAAHADVVFDYVGSPFDADIHGTSGAMVPDRGTNITASFTIKGLVPDFTGTVDISQISSYTVSDGVNTLTSADANAELLGGGASGRQIVNGNSTLLFNFNNGNVIGWSWGVIEDGFDGPLSVFESAGGADSAGLFLENPFDESVGQTDGNVILYDAGADGPSPWVEVSDGSVAVPEPSAIALLGAGLLLTALLYRRRRLGPAQL
jgi:hypothetical protein